MKQKIIIAACLLLATSVLHAQEDKEIELKDLEVPNSPAFSLLDISPTVIDKPGTPKAFTASLVNLIGEGKSLPKNFAMEFAPFWLFKNSLNVYQYMGMGKDGKKENVFSNMRNTSISLGSVFIDSTAKKPFDVNYISVGIRSNIITIRNKTINEATVKCMDDISVLINKNLNIPVSTACGNLYEPGSEKYMKCLQDSLAAAIEKNKRAIEKLEKKLKSLTSFKPTFLVDLAGATSWSFVNNTFGNNKSYRSAVWTTASYSQPLSGIGDLDKLIGNKNYLNLSILLRYMDENSTADFISFSHSPAFDIGGKISLDIDRFSLALETISRNYSKSGLSNTSRTVGILQYKVRDDLFISGTFGKNFGEITNLFSQFGINWGFGKQSIVR